MANQKQLAAHLDLTDRQVRNLLTDGVLPGSKGNGGLDFEAGRLAYIRYLRGLSAGQVKAETASHVEEGIDPLIEYKLMEERRGLTAAQRVGQENKNAVSSRQLVPVDFAVFALTRIAAQVASILDTVAHKVARKHPDIDHLYVETMQREIALARNIAAGLGENLPAILDEYLDQLEEVS
ncbi:terminase small subunit [Pseudomonas rossensis]|uniref:terminase small subunit n=1 Tax=Pseudomonas rossensis TaxID=2305471 RepID=UPI0032618663